ncbi:MAG: PQQ-binding-like beta-propeller repeat protein [Pirellulales bacterium]|nr:PQQ-binding-like beta-propeller repeat protein [Pirellulales bacterium]
MEKTLPMKTKLASSLLASGLFLLLANGHTRANEANAHKVEAPKPVGVKDKDWAQWGGSTIKNNTPEAKNIPSEWEVGEIDDETGEWTPGSGQNIKWAARLGSQSYGNPVIANGKVYVGSNNGAGYLKRYPATVDLGVLLCFNEADGKFLWQHSSEKLPTGRVHDWPLQGICCAPLVEGDKLWFVTSRGEVVCLDTEGFRDNGENDGPYTSETHVAEDEADIVWKLDMMSELGVSQHNMCSCSVTSAGDLLFVNTSNGVDEGHAVLPSPSAPTFLCLDKNTGKVLWTDNSPGANVLHGQWSSPAFAVIDGVPQVLFGAGDGWLYSFRGEATPDGKPELLWKFDCNPKESKYALQRATRNHIIGTPVIYNGLVFIGVGEDPEHGEGAGHLWCIDPTKRGDVSPELAFNLKDLKTPIPHRRIQAVNAEEGEVARPNPNSAAVWHYTGVDSDGDGKLEFEETMHRTCGTVAIKDDILYVADFSGLFHCLDAKTGQPYWTHDMLAAAWGSPLIVDDKVYIGDEDGDITVLKHGKELEIISEINMGNSVYSTPVIANGVLYIANKSHLFAIVPEEGADEASEN